MHLPVKEGFILGAGKWRMGPAENLLTMQGRGLLGRA